MLTSETLQQLRSIVEEVSAREGCRLYQLEFVGHGGNRTLRIYIDGESQPVSIDQCANVSRALSLRLDVDDLVPGGGYELEVSSPGLERPLVEPWHYEKAMGKMVRLTTKEPLPLPPGVETKKGVGPKSLTGQLLEMNGEVITLVDEAQRQWTVPLSGIHKAKTVFEPVKAVKAKNKKR